MGRANTRPSDYYWHLGPSVCRNDTVVYFVAYREPWSAGNIVNVPYPLQLNVFVLLKRDELPCQLWFCYKVVTMEVVTRDLYEEGVATKREDLSWEIWTPKRLKHRTAMSGLYVNQLAAYTRTPHRAHTHSSHASGQNSVRLKGSFEIIAA